MGDNSAHYHNILLVILHINAIKSHKSTQKRGNDFSFAKPD